MLLFCCPTPDERERLRQGQTLPGVRCWTRYEAAAATGCAPVLLVEVGTAPEVGSAASEPAVVVPLSASVCRNLDPYLPLRPVSAAGGVLVRPGAAELEVLLIFRRGVWDLPKGKQDAGETLEACALREVKEELGIPRKSLRLTHRLGITRHAYPERGFYWVKTTWWYRMETTATRFVPQAGEGIEAVAWFPWSTAATRLGYATLREPLAWAQEVEARGGTVD